MSCNANCAFWRELLKSAGLMTRGDMPFPRHRGLGIGRGWTSSSRVTWPFFSLIVAPLEARVNLSFG